MSGPAILASRVRTHLQTPLYRNSYALMASTALASALGLVYWTLAARLYSPEAVGLNSAVISVMIFLAGVAQLNLLSVMVRYLPVAGPASGRLIGLAYTISVVLATAVGLVFVAGIGVWAPALGFLQADPYLALWFILGMCAWCIFTLQDSVLTGMRRTTWVPLENLAYAVAKILLLLLLAGSLPIIGIFAAWTLPVFAALIPINLLVFARFVPAHQTSSGDQSQPLVPRLIAKYIAGNYLGQLASIAVARLLPLLVITQLGATANAYFYLPWTIAVALRLVTSDMVLALTVEAVREERNLGLYALHFFKHLARLFVPIITLVLLGAPWILGLAGPNYAAEGTMLLRLLALAAIPGIVTSVYIGIARVQNRFAGIFGVQALPGALILGLSYWLLPSYGITAVGYAVLSCETLVALVLVLTQWQNVRRLVSAKPLVGP